MSTKMNPKKTAIYTRSATKDGEAIASQVRRCRNYLRQKGWDRDAVDAVRIFTDNGVSGSHLRRPAFQEMMDQARAGTVGLIVFAELSRISRSLEYFHTLQDEWNLHGVQWASVTEELETTTDSGALTVSLMRLLNEFEQQQSIKHGRT